MKIGVRSFHLRKIITFNNFVGCLQINGGQILLQVVQANTPETTKTFPRTHKTYLNWIGMFCFLLNYINDARSCVRAFEVFKWLASQKETIFWGKKGSLDIFFFYYLGRVTSWEWTHARAHMQEMQQLIFLIPNPWKAKLALRVSTEVPEYLRGAGYHYL